MARSIQRGAQQLLAVSASPCTTSCRSKGCSAALPTEHHVGRPQCGIATCTRWTSGQYLAGRHSQPVVRCYVRQQHICHWKAADTCVQTQSKAREAQQEANKALREAHQAVRAMAAAPGSQSPVVS